MSSFLVRRLRPHSAALLALLLCTASAAPALAQTLPFGLGQVTSLHEARQRLWELRETNQIDQGRYLQLARQMEPGLRSNDVQSIMDDLGIKHTGRAPVKSGGILSDIDGTALTEDAYQQFLARMRKLDPNLEVYDRYSFRSEKYDVVGWRPPDSVPRRSGYAAEVEQGMGQSLNNELAPTAIPGGKPNAMEANLEDLTKGAHQMFKPVRGGYQGEADMVAAGKDVLRSMKAAGLCDDNPAICGWLNDLRSRARSPKELGFSSNAELQDRLKELAGQAFRASEDQFKAEYEGLVAQLRKAGTGPERDRLVELADEMAERATRMAARYETLQKQYPKAGEVTGPRTVSEFWGEQTERVRQLQQGRQTVIDNVARAHSLNFLLNVLEFAHCLQEDTIGTTATRRAKAQECILRQVKLFALSKGAEWMIGKSINLITVSLPNGAMIASVLPAVLTGVVAVQTGLQLIDAGFEYWQTHQAELEADRSENALAQQQIRNVAEFPRHLAAEEKAVDDALRAIEARKAALLDYLMRLGTEQASLIDQIHLSARRIRLDHLLPAIKEDTEACFSELGDTGAAPDPAAEVLGLGAQARQFAASCRDRQDLQHGDEAFQAASDRMNTLRRASTPATGLAAQAGAVQSDEAKALDEARRINVALGEAALKARRILHDLEHMRDRVNELNDSIERDQQYLAGRLEAFEQSVPPTMLQLLQENSPRLTALRRRIDGIETLPDDAWYQKWTSIRQKDLPLRTLLEYMDESGVGIDKILRDAEDCQQRRAGNDALGRAEDEWAEATVSFRSQRAICVARLDALDAGAGFQQRLAQEEAGLKAALDSARSTHDALAARYESALQTAQGLVAQRAAAARVAGGSAKAAALTAEVGAAPAFCSEAQSAGQKLADALRSIESDEDNLEATLTEAQRLAAHCQDGPSADLAEAKLLQAAGLQTSVDQRAAALALLAVQVDSLATRRTALLKRRDEAAAFVQGPPAAPPLPPVDFGPLEGALNEMRAHGDSWGAQQAERDQQHLAQLQAEFAAVPPATRAAGVARLRPLVDGIVATAWKGADVQQRAGVLAALRQAAEAANRPAADTHALEAAVQAAACLDPALPNMSAGIEQADTLRSIAQLTTQKLGGPARDMLTTCTDRLNHGLSNADKQARVAAKVCSYPGSEAVWDEGQYRPMCRCTSGRKWNTEETACVAVDKDAEVAAKHCTYPGSEAYWDANANRPMCRCPSGAEWNADRSACVDAKEAQLARADCSR